MRLKWLQLIMQNHQISCEVQKAQHEDPKSLCDRIQMAVARHEIKVHGKMIRAGLEVSPARN